MGDDVIMLNGGEPFSPSRLELEDVYPAATAADVHGEAFTSFLDFARWTAAAMVFVGHLRNPMFLGYRDVAPADGILPVKLWYFLTGWHAEAVIVFFVLSGYLVGGLSAAKVQSGRFSPRGYAIDRFSRIYVAFFPALILTVVLDHVGSTWLGGAGLYDGTQIVMHDKISAGAFTQNMSVKTFGLNLVLLQTFFAPPYGSNQPLWTVSAEFWFYVVFGLTTFAFLRRRSYIGLASLIAGLGLAVALGVDFITFMGLWMIGMGGAFVPRGRLEQPLLALLAFVAALVFVRVKQNFADDNLRMAKNFFVAVVFLWLLVSVRHANMSWIVRLAGINKRLADFSFSLYLIHFPVLIFSLSACHATGLFPGISVGYSPTDPTGLMLYLGIIALVYGLSYLFSVLTEQRTPRIRRALLRIGSSGPSANPD